MVLFISSEVMFFAALFGAYFAIRAEASTWPPAGTPEIDVVAPALATLVLVSSSVTAHLTVRATAAGAADRARRWLALTMLLGGVFLAAQLVEYPRSDLSVADNVFTALFVTMTGFHGLHVLGGLIVFSVARARLGREAGEGMLEAASYYWHFVDVVWLGLFTLLYLFP